MAKDSNEEFSKREVRERFERALRAGLKTPAKPHSEMKIGNGKGRKAKAPTKRSGPRSGAKKA